MISSWRPRILATRKQLPFLTRGALRHIICHWLMLLSLAACTHESAIALCNYAMSHSSTVVARSRSAKALATALRMDAHTQHAAGTAESAQPNIKKKKLQLGPEMRERNSGSGAKMRLLWLGARAGQINPRENVFERFTFLRWLRLKTSLLLIIGPPITVHTASSANYRLAPPSKCSCAAIRRIMTLEYIYLWLCGCRTRAVLEKPKGPGLAKNNCVLAKGARHHTVTAARLGRCFRLCHTFKFRSPPPAADPTHPKRTSSFVRTHNTLLLADESFS